MGIASKEVNRSRVEADNLTIHIDEGALQSTVEWEGLFPDLETRKSKAEFLQHVKDVLESLRGRAPGIWSENMVTTLSLLTSFKYTSWNGRHSRWCCCHLH